MTEPIQDSIDAFIDFKNQQKQAQGEPALSPEEKLAMKEKYMGWTAEGEQERIAGRGEDLGSQAKHYGIKALEKLAQGLDVGRAIVAPAIQQVALPNQKGYQYGRTWKQALEDAGMQTKSLSQILPSMYDQPGEDTWKPDVGGALDPTGSGGAGFALDMATDPLTYLGAVGPAKRAIKAGLGKLAGIVGKGGEAGVQAAEGTFRGAIPKAAEMAAETPTGFRYPTGKRALTYADEAAAGPGERALVPAGEAPKQLPSAPIDAEFSHVGGGPEVVGEAKPRPKPDKGLEDILANLASPDKSIPEKTLGQKLVGTAMGVGQLPSKTVEAVGSHIYKAPFKSLGLERASIVEGKGSFAKTMNDLGFAGGLEKLEDVTSSIEKASLDGSRAILSKTAGTPAAINLREVLAPHMAKLEEMAATHGGPRAADAQKLLLHLNQEVAGSEAAMLSSAGRDTRGLIDLAKANEAKTSIGDVWHADEAAKIHTARVKRIANQAYGDVQKAIENEIGMTLGPKAKEAFSQKNQIYGKMLAVRQKVRDAALKGDAVPPLSGPEIGIMAGTIGLGATTGGKLGMAMEGGAAAWPLIRRLLSANRTMAGGTHTGRAMQWVGQNATFLPDAFYRRGIIDEAGGLSDEDAKEQAEFNKVRNGK